MSETLKNLVVGMGYHDDNWHSCRIHAEQLYEYLSPIVSDQHTLSLFAPKLGRKPNWLDRRIRYRHTLPKGELFHLVDPAYGDSLFAANKNFNHTIVTVTDLAFWLDRTKFNSFLRKSILNGVKAAGTTIAISKKTSVEMEKHLGKAADHVIYLGSEPDLFPHCETKRDPYLLLHVGTVMERKGIDRIIRLLSLLPKEYRFSHIGSPFSDGQIKLIDKLDLNDRVEYKDFVGKNELVKSYQTAGIFLFPSRYEGYGVPVIEARLCGTPVIMSDVVPSSEVLENDDGTLILDFSTFDNFENPEKQRLEVEKIVKFPAEPIKLKNRERYSWQHTAKQTLEVYSMILG